MHPEMRRSDRKLSEEETREILENAEFGVLSTVGEDGMPYGVPISFALGEGKIYMHGTNAGGHKAKNMAANPDVCFTVVGSHEPMPEKFGTKYSSAIVFGKVRTAGSDEERKEAMTAILQKYCADYMEGGLKYMNASWEKFDVYVLEIDEAIGKARKQ